MELVSSELKRRSPEGSGQDKGKAEKAYAAVEAKPTGGTIERNCFACKKLGHLVADCPENPNRGEKVGTSEPPKKKQNTGKHTTMDDVTTKDDVMRTDARHHVDKRRMQVVSGPVSTVVLTMVTEDVKTTVVVVIRGVNLLVTDHHLLNTAVSHADTGTDGTVLVFVLRIRTNTSTVIRLRDMMIVDTIHSIMPAHHRSTAMLGRHSSMETNKAHPSGLVINVDHHPEGATRRHLDQETSLRREDVDAHHREAALVHVNALTISKAVAVLMSVVGVRTTVVVTDHPVAETHTAVRISLKAEAGSHPSPVMNRESWRSEFQEDEKDLIAAHIRDKGMACVRRGDGTYEYKFERNRASNSGEEEDSDEGGSSGVLVITRDDIIANINKNPKMTRTEKRLTRAGVKKRFDLEARMEAKRRGYTDRQRAVRRAARAIRRGDNPSNWRQVLGGSPPSPEDPYASDSVYSEEGLRFLSAAEAQEKQQKSSRVWRTSFVRTCANAKKTRQWSRQFL
ncbi:hypothetical protein PF004_g30302 [Phytophthora fragariae]|uniref:CCHC-type domain-containing protein n=1 Tax=Phytophthora fragariae TaxID=53985 RepID=A0A6G0MCM5_9STRA|nr:hypothetical protein PF004_g30302 [Phytophthora fragariae]